MLRWVTGVLLAGAVVLGCASPAVAEEITPTGAAVSYERGRIASIQKSEGTADVARVVLLSGPNRGATVEATTSGLAGSLDVLPPPYEPGDTVVLSIGEDPLGGTAYAIVDHYRIPLVGWIFAGILVLAIFFAGWRGVGALLGLVLSVVVLAGFVIPRALATGNPYPPTAVGVLVISFVGIYVAHGFSRRTTLALISTYVTLLLAVGLSLLIVSWLDLGGASSDETFYLQQKLPGLNIPGLLICGMIISTIGILDDVTVGQAATVEELARVNPEMSAGALYASGLRIGREHIASLINTLVLAYVGTSLVFVAYVKTGSSQLRV